MDDDFINYAVDDAPMPGVLTRAHSESAIARHERTERYELNTGQSWSSEDRERAEGKRQEVESSRGPPCDLMLNVFRQSY